MKVELEDSKRARETTVLDSETWFLERGMGLWVKKQELRKYRRRENQRSHL
jgi:hypothetical protein